MSGKSVKTAKTVGNSLGQQMSELSKNIWSVISFEKLEAGNLTYREAKSKMDELSRQGSSGLCIITGVAAARVKPTR